MNKYDIKARTEVHDGINLDDIVHIVCFEKANDGLGELIVQHDAIVQNENHIESMTINTTL